VGVTGFEPVTSTLSR